MKLRIKYPVIVEGRYDKIKLSSIIEGEIITTEGFGVFRDKDKLELIRRLALQDKVILLTDSDRAGFRIRSYLSGAIDSSHLVQIYIPERQGKERRKEQPSAEGTVGVEGIDADELRRLFAEAGALEDSAEPTASAITRQLLYELGLSGQESSAILRRRLLERLGLPTKLSTSALCGVLSRLTTPEELTRIVQELHS